MHISREQASLSVVEVRFDVANLLRKYKSYQASLLRSSNLADAHLDRLSKVSPFSKERVTVFFVCSL